MWGEVTPAERLRAVTRRRIDEDRLAIEAADALAGFASEPASLVVACRRVLAHHRSCGPLWLNLVEPGLAHTLEIPTYGLDIGAHCWQHISVVQTPLPTVTIRSLLRVSIPKERSLIHCVGPNGQ